MCRRDIWVNTYQTRHTLPRERLILCRDSRNGHPCSDVEINDLGTFHLSPRRRRSLDVPRDLGPIMHETEPDVVSVTETIDRRRDRHRDLKFGITLQNPFRPKRVRIVDKRQSPRRRSSDMEDRGRFGDRPPPGGRERRYYVSPGGTARVIASSRREEVPTVEYISPRDEPQQSPEPRPSTPVVEVVDSGDEGPPLGGGEWGYPYPSGEETDFNIERLEAAAREARRIASRERRRRREAESEAERARIAAYNERDRRRDAERRVQHAEDQADLAEARRRHDAREAARARDRSRERSRERRLRAIADEEDRQRHLFRLYPPSGGLLRHQPFERREDLRRERADPGARLILEAQDAYRYERGRSYGRGDCIVYDDDNYRAGRRWR